MVSRVGFGFLNFGLRGLTGEEPSTRWSSRGSLARSLERNGTKFVPHKALKLIARGKSTFDERVELHRVGCGPHFIASYQARVCIIHIPTFCTRKIIHNTCMHSTCICMQD